MKSQFQTSLSANQTLATLIQRPGRNEILITPLTGPQQSITFTNEQITAFVWLASNPTTKSRKRTQQASDERLAVLIDGDVLIWSKNSDEVVNKISTDFSFNCMQAKRGKDYDLILGDENGLKFYHSEGAKIINSISIGNVKGLGFSEGEEIIAFNDHVAVVDEYFEVVKKNEIELPGKVINVFNGIICCQNGLLYTEGKFIKLDGVIGVRQIGDLVCAIYNNGVALLKDSEIVATLVIQGGDKVGKFIDLIPGNVFRGVWFDGFNVHFCEMEFEDLGKLTGTIEISVVEDVDVIEEQTIEEESMVDTDMEPEDDSWKQYEGEIKLIDHYKNQVLESDDGKFCAILRANEGSCKNIIYFLSDDETKILFKNICFCYTQGHDELKTWFKMLLIIKGGVLVDEESIGWLKLVRSGLRDEARALKGVLKLRGKCELLKDQLVLRKQMTGRTISTTQEDNEGVFVDGEYDVDDEEEAEEEEEEEEDEQVDL
ncbi:hypothetical protein DAMA08_019770 [Martiniozyma asiatica (nom. inval.)]|nr:hypothetical protein DAMA08_019770 [Martiniozyma asiatica]